MGSAFKRLERNTGGRDFVVGDLHGMFSTLEGAMDQLGFDRDRDRMISVGDLIDRGPESHRALEFLEQPWFFAVQGNHERLLLESEIDRDLASSWVTLNGGEWWMDVDPITQDRFRRRLRALPFALEADTEPGQVGVVHADIPPQLSWVDFLEQLERDQRVREYATWSRKRIGRVLKDEAIPPIEGLALLVVGHTPIEEAMRRENIYYLDTGAAYGKQMPHAKLSILQIHPQWVLNSFPTAPKPTAQGSP
ncbi:metallophosphoesterase [Ectothiorhodospira marina]|jgi:serine/threonine protein phosphatase 1|uniref:Serine/threonine protein phosphatase 1 n=1 Tax=Ectothiorhodospira marina TaxID=1396821 RepID=A0A1H7FCP1_9GAMM|nr:metallophosphoesterase [Ectothiorhodospira marina]SEK23077.1 serine/threonine protein phosphatase 1 [Ectothiorhodospira marina]